MDTDLSPPFEEPVPDTTSSTFYIYRVSTKEVLLTFAKGLS